METLIYDAELCAGGPCPKFVVDEEKQVVSLIDRQGRRAEMTVEHFNTFVKAVKSGDIKELASLKRK